MNKYQDLLIKWCDSLVKSQITDEKSNFFGGFRCESCGFAHGRADNAIYPLTYAYVLTGENKYLSCAERLLVFRKKLTKLSGTVQNDFDSKWKGITSFSAINLLKTLIYFGDKIPLEFKNKIEKCAKRSARWVHRRMTIGFSANINYYCAAALVNALYAKRYGDVKYKVRAKELIAYCLNLFTENGLFSGEAKPHDGVSPRGCRPIDIGYIVEESMPCLIHAATLLGDEKALSFLTESAKKQLDFMLPDGGWDNSFGVRNNKWTYYGSRTSDGCIGVFCELAKKDDLFAEAAERTFAILKRCTHDGKLYGGMQYYENGQKACIHHTFCHACALADAIYAGVPEKTGSKLPCDTESVGYKYYPEIDTYKIRAGKYIATLTGFDYATYTYANGASHAGGGTLSLLYKQGTGPMIAGSVYDYRRTEKNNMQEPAAGKKHAPLLVRAEYEKNGKKYATCLDKDPEITVETDGDAVTARVKAKFFCVETRSAENNEVCAEIIYRFAPESVIIKVGKINEGIKFVLPVVENSGKVETENGFQKEKIFFLTGGFSADEYTFSLAENVTVTIK